MFEQMDGQILAKENTAKPAPLVSNEDMRNHLDSMPKKVQPQSPFVLEFSDPFGNTGKQQLNDSAEHGPSKGKINNLQSGDKFDRTTVTADSVSSGSNASGEKFQNSNRNDITKPGVPADGGAKDKISNLTHDVGKPAEPKDGGLKEKVLGDATGGVRDESKPAEPKDGGLKAEVCTPEDPSGRGISLPPLELVDPRVAEARRRLDRIENYSQ